MGPRQRKEMLLVPEAGYDEVRANNLTGPFFLTQRVARAMIAVLEEGTIQESKIVKTCSVSAAASSSEPAEDCLSNGGVSMMTRLWADRLSRHGMLVYELRPGIVLTDMTVAVKAKYDRLLLEQGLALTRR